MLPIREEVIRYFKSKEDDNTLPFGYDEKRNAIINENGEYVCSLDYYIEELKKKTGRSFECIHDEHIELRSTLRCTECGTVIMYQYDEHFERDLQCPTCTDYQTSYTYWTKEEIDADIEKQNYIKFQENQAKRWKEYNDLLSRRKGKCCSELTKQHRLKETDNGYWAYQFMVYDIRNIWPLKGLHLKLSYYKFSKKRVTANLDKIIYIPLSFTYLWYWYKNKRKRRKFVLEHE